MSAAHSWNATPVFSPGGSNTLSTGAVASANNDTVSVKIGFFNSGATFVSLADNKGNTYPAALFNFFITNPGWQLVQIILPGIAGGSGHTFTATFTGFPACTLTVDGYSGCALSSVVDVSQPFVDTSFQTVHAGAAVTPLLAGDILDGFILTTNGTDTFTAGGGFSLIAQVNGAGAIACSDLAGVSAGTSYAAAFTGTQFSASAGTTVALKVAGAAVAAGGMGLLL